LSGSKLGRALAPAAPGIFLSAPCENLIAWFDRRDRNIGQVRHFGVEGTEIGPRRDIEQIGQRGDDEIDLLKIVDAIERAHYPFEIEAQAVWRIRGKREDRL